MFDRAIGGGNVESVCVQDCPYLRCIKRRPPIGMIHHKVAFAPQLMPHSERRTDRASRIAGCRLYVDPSEWRVSSNFTVGDGVHRTATRQREICQSRPSLQITEEVKECLLVHRLDRASDVIVALFELIARRAALPQQML